MRLWAKDVGLPELVRLGAGLVISGGSAGDLVLSVNCGDSPGGEAVMVAMLSSSLTLAVICDHARQDSNALLRSYCVGCCADGRPLPRSRRSLSECRRSKSNKGGNLAKYAEGEMRNVEPRLEKCCRSAARVWAAGARRIEWGIRPSREWNWCVERMI